MKPFVKRMLAVSTAAMCVACAVALSACNSADGQSKGNPAAVLGETVIYENDVTTYIQTFRAQYGLMDDASWAGYLSYYGMDAAGLREAVIKNMTFADVLPQAAEKAGVSVAAEDVDAAVDKMKTSNGLSDEQWAAALANSGYTEESYRTMVEQSLLQDALEKKMAEGAEVTDEIFDEYGMIYVRAYYSEMRRSSHILFAPEDEAKAAEVLAKLQSGELAFADAVAEYSIDTGSAVNGGDVGWDGMTTFVTEYQTALDELEEGEMSGLVQSQFGYHIILCTDHFVCDENTPASEVPDEVRELISAYFLKSIAQEEAYDALLDETRESMGFVMYDMPAGLPYDVDVEAVLAAAEAEHDHDHDHDHEGEGSGEETAK